MLYKSMLSQVDEKGPRVVSSSRSGILSIDLVRRVFKSIRMNFGR